MQTSSHVAAASEVVARPPDCGHESQFARCFPCAGHGIDDRLRWVTKHMATALLADKPTQSFLADSVRLYMRDTGGFLSLGAGYHERSDVTLHCYDRPGSRRVAGWVAPLTLVVLALAGDGAVHRVASPLGRPCRSGSVVDFMTWVSAGCDGHLQFRRCGHHAGDYPSRTQRPIGLQGACVVVGMSRLASKVALITGAARGIGAAISRAFVGNDAFVYVTDINDELGRSTAKELGTNATYLHLAFERNRDWRLAMSRVLEDKGEDRCCREQCWDYRV